MISDFPCRRQRGSYDCLPTAVGAVLEWHQIGYTPANLSEWCGVQPGGCDWYDALDGLKAEGFSLHEPQDFEEICDFVKDLKEPLPIIATVVLDARQYGSDHAVVIVGILPEVIVFMDPTTGELRQCSQIEFCKGWQIAGNRAVAILG